MRVVLVMERDTLRMTGGLGPLQALPVFAVMNVGMKAAGTGTEVTFTYSASGYFPDGLGSLAAPVDAVLGAQWAAFKKVADAL